MQRHERQLVARRVCNHAHHRLPGHVALLDLEARLRVATSAIFSATSENVNLVTEKADSSSFCTM
jgi:hypothetical protein